MKGHLKTYESPFSILPSAKFESPDYIQGFISETFLLKQSMRMIYFTESFV